MRIIIVLAFLVVATAAFAQQPPNYGVAVDRVVAVVEDDAIFRSEVIQSVKQVMMQQGLTDVEPAAREDLEKRALQELINSRLILAKANTLGIDVSFSEVEQYVERAINENMSTLGGEAAFERQLASEGLTMDQLRQLYRDQIRNRMIVERVLSAEVNRGSLQVTDDEIRALYEERKAVMPLRPAVAHLATIYISFSSAENAVNSAKTKIDGLYQRIIAGEDFADVAREYSEDPSAKNGGKLGTVKPDDLADQVFAGVVKSLDVGGISEPVKTQHGYHIVMVTARNPAAGEVDVSHILVRAKAGDDDVQQIFTHATDIYDQLMAGGDFEALAREYSDDPGTADAGGDLGWLRVEDLPEFFRDVLRGMEPGQISQVLREPEGFRIVKLIETEDSRPYTFEEVRDELRQLAEQKKLGDSYELYVEGLRDEFYVDVRVN